MMKFISNRKRWEKILCSAIVGAILAIFTSWELDAFMDTIVMVFVYCCWIFFSLPSIYKKLTVKLLSDVIIISFQFFIADFVIFGVYNYLKQYATGKEAVYNTVEQRGYVFLMNLVRVVVIGFCALRSLKAFWDYMRTRRRTDGTQQKKKRKYTI